MNIWIFLVPFITALIGWLIARFVIKMFFQPNFARREAIAELVARLVCDDAISFTAIAAKISNTGDIKKIMPAIESNVDSYLRNKLNKTFPVMRVFIGGKTINQLKNIFMEQMEQVFPILLQNQLNNLSQDLDFEKIIRQKLSALPSDKFQDLLQAAVGKDLRYAKWAGALGGFVIGLLSVLSAYFMLR